MDPQQILDRFYLGDFEFVATHIDEVTDESLCDEKECIKRLLNDEDDDLRLIRTILDIKSSKADRRKAWVDLRSRDSSLLEAQYAIGMCNLDGDMAETPKDMTEFAYTLQKLGANQSPVASVIRMLYLIAGARTDLVANEFEKLSTCSESGIPDLAQIWTQFVAGSHRAALESCDEAEEAFGEFKKGSTRHMQSLRAVCALHAGMFDDVEKFVDPSNAADLINLASAKANLLDLPAMETTLALIKDRLPEDHPYLRPLIALETL